MSVSVCMVCSRNVDGNGRGFLFLCVSFAHVLDNMFLLPLSGYGDATTITITVFLAFDVSSISMILGWVADTLAVWVLDGRTDGHTTTTTTIFLYSLNCLWISADPFRVTRL